jgi:hypothetical protein
VASGVSRIIIPVRLVEWSELMFAATIFKKYLSRLTPAATRLKNKKPRSGVPERG